MTEPATQTLHWGSPIITTRSSPSLASKRLLKAAMSVLSGTAGTRGSPSHPVLAGSVSGSSTPSVGCDASIVDESIVDESLTGDSESAGEAISAAGASSVGPLVQPVEASRHEPIVRRKLRRTWSRSHERRLGVNGIGPRRLSKNGREGPAALVGRQGRRAPRANQSVIAPGVGGPNNRARKPVSGAWNRRDRDQPRRSERLHLSRRHRRPRVRLYRCDGSLPPSCAGGGGQGRNPTAGPDQGRRLRHRLPPGQRAARPGSTLVARVRGEVECAFKGDEYNRVFVTPVVFLVRHPRLLGP
ncbi:MAG: hypothetical protein ACI9WU_002531 [Myxococcota bacterium]|jgi:hypothetical protein